MWNKVVGTQITTPSRSNTHHGRAFLYDIHPTSWCLNLLAVSLYRNYASVCRAADAHDATKSTSPAPHLIPNWATTCTMTVPLLSILVTASKLQSHYSSLSEPIPVSREERVESEPLQRDRREARRDAPPLRGSEIAAKEWWIPRKDTVPWYQDRALKRTCAPGT